MKLMLNSITKLLFAVVFLSSIATKAQVYTYPIRPSMPEWRALKTHTAMLKATELPQQYLQANTADLLESCLTYPLLFDFMAFNNPLNGLKRVIAQSNVLSVFMKRPNCGEALLNYYKKMNIESINLVKDQIAQGRQSFLITAVELLLADSMALTTLSAIKRNELLSVAIKNITLKEKNGHIFSNISLFSSLFVASNILNQSGNKEWEAFYEENKSLSTFLNNYAITKEQFLNLKTFMVQLKK